MDARDVVVEDGVLDLGEILDVVAGRAVRLARAQAQMNPAVRAGVHGDAVVRDHVASLPDAVVVIGP